MKTSSCGEERTRIEAERDAALAEVTEQCRLKHNLIGEIERVRAERDKAVAEVAELKARRQFSLDVNNDTYKRLTASRNALAAQVAALRERVLIADVASCTCQTKTPEPQYHAERCPHRVYTELLALTPSDAVKQFADMAKEVERLKQAEVKAEKMEKLAYCFIPKEQLREFERVPAGQVVEGGLITLWENLAEHHAQKRAALADDAMKRYSDMVKEVARLQESNNILAGDNVVKAQIIGKWSMDYEKLAADNARLMGLLESVTSGAEHFGLVCVSRGPIYPEWVKWQAAITAARAALTGEAKP